MQGLPLIPFCRCWSFRCILSWACPAWQWSSSDPATMQRFFVSFGDAMLAFPSSMGHRFWDEETPTERLSVLEMRRHDIPPNATLPRAWQQRAQRWAWPEVERTSKCWGYSDTIVTRWQSSYMILHVATHTTTCAGRGVPGQCNQLVFQFGIEWNRI